MSETFEIYSGVAIPPSKRGNLVGRTAKYPFGDMDVGDLMVIPGKASKSFGGTVRSAEKRTGFAFTLRSGPIEGTDADGKAVVVVPAGAVGVWRIAEKAPKKVLTPEQVAKRAAKKAAKAAAKLAKAA